ncbi:prolyl oligopeptidase family serine peptidase (plasmid) [Streptomyces sp. BI20]|uniref:prolyl oligopeptidase family serine peptidase n=1 Tax=Streptomyces sp. BI20 TaxID=3403460 RepID=UPI003C776912
MPDPTHPGPRPDPGPRPGRPDPVYPPAPRSGLVETRHGLRVADPYRVLEDPCDPRTAAWSAAQDALFRAARARWSAPDAVAARVRELLDTGDVSVPLVRGRRFFLTRQDPGRDRPELVVVEGDAVRVLLDPLVWDPTGRTVLDAWSPSWEGDLIAVQTSSDGTEDSVLHVLDRASGKVVDGPIGRLRRTDVAWLPGGGSFYYVRRLPPEEHPGEERYHRRVWHHRVGTDPVEDTEVFGRGRAAADFYSVDLASDGRLLTVTVTAGASPDAEVWAADPLAGDPARPLLRPVRPAGPGRTTVWAHRRGVLSCTRVGAPRGRVELVEPRGPGDPMGARRVLVPEDAREVLVGAALLDGPELPGPLVLVTRTLHGIGSIGVHDADTGRELGRVPLPGRGSVGVPTPAAGPGHEVWFRYTDHVTPARVLRYDALRHETTPWAGPGAPSPVGGAVGAVVTESVCASADGTPVRMYVISPAGRPDRPRATVVTGYGGFGASIVPGYAGHALAWVEAGGVWVFTCLRGGGEEGEDWHRAGRRERKTNTFADLEAAVDHLVAQGWADGSRVGLLGSSNGGLTVGAALTRRPERYAAVVALAPLLDMVRYERSGLGPSWREEYGTAEDPAQAAVLLSYSPYHRVRPGVRYPAVLLGVADGDTRVDPLHARKMCAALQAASTRPFEEGPVLLRRETGLGHGARGTGDLAALLGDALAFFTDRLRP